MSFVSRGTRAAARPLRQTATRQSRRSASNQSHDHHAAEHGSHESALHVAGGSGNESFGKGFYITLASIPIAYLTYTFATGGDTFISRSYRDYQNRLAKHEAQDVLHSAALDQAISDRASVVREPRSTTRELRYPEMFNQGSPWNVVSGEGTADLRKLEAYYVQQREEMEKARVARMGK